MSTINYSEKIPNNVNLGEDRTLQRALRLLVLQRRVGAQLLHHALVALQRDAQLVPRRRRGAGSRRLELGLGLGRGGLSLHALLPNSARIGAVWL